MRYYCQVWIYGFSQATDPPCFPSARNVELLLLDKETRVRRLKCPCLRLRLWRLKWLTLTLTRLLAWSASASCEPVMHQRRPCAPGLWVTIQHILARAAKCWHRICDGRFYSISLLAARQNCLVIRSECLRDF